jgi:hypothetical protein
MVKKLAMVAIVVAVMLASAPAAAADPRLDDLCRNPAFANMHENECVIRGNGPGRSNGGDGGLLGVIGRIVGGLL